LVVSVVAIYGSGNYWGKGCRVFVFTLNRPNTKPNRLKGVTNMCTAKGCKDYNKDENKIPELKEFVGKEIKSFEPESAGIIINFEGGESITISFNIYDQVVKLSARYRRR
jgi:hypothetical protein